MKLSQAGEQERSSVVSSEDRKRIVALQGLFVSMAQSPGEVHPLLQELRYVLGLIPQTDQEVTSKVEGNAQGGLPPPNLEKTIRFVNVVRRASTSENLDSLQGRIQVQQDFAQQLLTEIQEAGEQERRPVISP